MAEQLYIGAPEESYYGEGTLSAEINNRPALTSDQARVNAGKAHLGLGNKSPGLDVITNSMLAGTEDNLRREVAAASRYEDALWQRAAAASLAQGQGTPSQGDLDFLRGIGSPMNPQANEKYVFEEAYGRTLVNSTFARNEDFLNDVMRSHNDPKNIKRAEQARNAFLDDADSTSNNVATQESTRRLIQELENEWQQTGWGSAAFQFGKELIPFYSWRLTQNAVPNAPTSSFLPGSNREEQYLYLWRLPHRERMPLLEAAVSQMKESSLLTAMQFAQGFLAFTGSDIAIANAFGVMDIASGAQIAQGGLKIAGKLAGMSRMADFGLLAPTIRRVNADILRANSKVSELPDLPKIMSQTGAVREGAEIAAAERLAENANQARPKTMAQGIKEVEDRLPSSASATQIFDDGSKLHRELTERLLAREAGNAILPNVVRLPADAMNAAISASRQRIIDTVTSKFDIANPVIDTIIHPVDQVTNTRQLTVRFGYNGQGFDSLDTARWHARNTYALGDEGLSWTPHQQGTSFYIDVTRNVDEFADLAITAAASGPNRMVEKSPLGTLFSRFRTPAETLAPQQVDNRAIAVTASNEMMAYARSITEDVNKLPRKMRNEFQRILLANRATVGTWWDNAKLEQQYQQIIGRMPTQAERDAYQGYRKAYDLDFAIRNLNRYRDKAIRGLESWSFRFKDEKGNTQSVPRFEGKVRETLPQGRNLSLLEYHPETNQFVTRSFGPAGMGDDMSKYFKELMEIKGYRLIDIEDPASLQFRQFAGNEPVQFILTKAPENYPLSFTQLPYNPGGHFDYAHKFWIKQPNIRVGAKGVTHYYGDIPFLNVSTAAQGRKVVADTNEAIRLMKAGDDVGLAAHLRKTLPFDVTGFKALFKPDENGVSRLSLDQELVLLETGQKSTGVKDFAAQYRDTGFRDLTIRQHDVAEGVDQRFAQQRDQRFYTIESLGTDLNPIINLVPAPLVDPLPTINRALSSAVRSRYFNDYRNSAVEAWVSQFANLIKGVDSTDEIRSTPIHYFYNATLKGDFESVQMAETMRERTKSLIGARTWSDQGIDYVKGKLADSIFNIAGQKAADWTAEKLSSAPNLISLMRGLAFHSTMGLFNWVQLFVQSNTYFHALAIGGPRNAGRALPAAYYTSTVFASNPTKKILSEYADQMVKFGWKREDFLESANLYFKSGFSRVGKEHAMQNTLDTSTVFQSKFGTFLDAGTFFFRAPEQMMRSNAWHMAYLEFKQANPAVKIGNAEMNNILKRADVMTMNMMSSNNSALQQGFLSIPTQMYGYVFRMAEQLTGKQLTRAEKMRVLGTYSLLYGLPSGAIASWTGLPAYESIKQAALSRGWTGGEADKNPMAEMLMEGLVATAVNWLGGGRLNVAERYGPGGLRLDFDKTALEIAAGVSGQYAQRFWTGAAGLLPYVSDVVSGKVESYRPLMQDIIDVARNVSSVNNAFGLYTALTTGNLVTKNMVVVDDQYSAPAAWIKAITGLDQRDVKDAFLIAKDRAKWKEFEDTVGKEFIKRYRQAYAAIASGDDAAGREFLRQAEAARLVANVDPNKVIEWVNEATRNSPLKDRIMRSYFEVGPMDRRQQRIDNFNKGQ